MSLPVPGGILAQLAPAGAVDPSALAAMAAMANANNGAPNPGAAIAPASIKPPTVAMNAQPLDHMDAPPVQADSLPTLQAPQHHGILGAIGDKLHDPEFRAEALRFAMGAMAPGAGGGLGGLSHGILAATQFADQRKAAAEDARRFDVGESDKAASRDLQGREINNNFALGHEGHETQRYGIDVGAATTERGQNVDERNNIRSNSTSRLNNHEDNATSRANTGDTVRASILNNNTDNATTRDVAAGNNATTIGAATITAGAKHQLDPKDAMHGLGQILPGMLGTNDAAGVAKALEAAPDLQAQLVDAYTNAYGDGSGNAMERAQKAVQGVLGKGASYTSDDHPFIPFMGNPAITAGTHDAPQDHGGKQIVSKGTDTATGKKVVQYSDGTISYAD